MKILITGGCGFLGSNLAIYGLEQGFDVVVFDNLMRLGSADNLKWLRGESQELVGNFTYINGDTRHKSELEAVFRQFGEFDAIFHVAGQVAMTTSIANPIRDFDINAGGTVNLLECVRELSKNAVVIFSSTNKVYGDLEQYSYSETPTRWVCDDFPDGFPETVGLDFHSPYGCSKGSADQYMLDYHRIFGLNTVVFRHSSMYGSRQFANSDQGWIGWFCQEALRQKRELEAGQEPKEFTISGDGKQVRDILHAEDMISLYYSAVWAIQDGKSEAGQAFNIGGNASQSLSLLELFSLLEDELGINLKLKKIPARESDQRVFIADTSKANRELGWTQKVGAKEGIQKMLKWSSLVAK
jgi:CDP-paratose 2-epimerase